jgi:hypothetical protein
MIHPNRHDDLSLVATNYFTALLLPTIELVLRGVARLETHRAQHSHITLASPSPIAPSTLDRSHLSLPDKLNIPIKSKGDPTPILIASIVTCAILTGTMLFNTTHMPRFSPLQVANSNFSTQLYFPVIHTSVSFHYNCYTYRIHL